MTAEQRSQEPTETLEGGALPSPSRRRLVRGVAGGAGVLLSVQAKTALGGTCKSPSATMSGNTSPRPGTGITCSGGRSPGFWKVPQKFNYWPTGTAYPTFKKPVSICSSGMQGLQLKDVLTQGTLLSSVFSGASSTYGLWAVLAFPNDCGGQLLRHLSAAYLNAGAFTTSAAQYPLTQDQVKNIWVQLNTTGLYCPTSLVGGCGTSGWNQTQVINYISGMYDLNSDLPPDPDLCTSP